MSGDKARDVLGDMESVGPLTIAPGKPSALPQHAVVLRIEVEREDDGRYFASGQSGDGLTGFCAEYAATAVGALANLCAVLIKIAEDEALERTESTA